MSDPSILALFEGLTPAEARTFRTRLLGAAQAIRSEVRPEPKRETQTERQAGMSKVPAELQKVQDAISDTEAKLAALKQTEKEATATVKEMEATLAAEVLDGSRIDESARVLTRERARLGASGNAKAQLESKLEALKQDKARLDYEAACGAYEGHAREVRRQLVHCFELLYDVVEGMPRSFFPPRGYTPSAESHLVQNMVEQLAGLDLYRGLVEFERLAPSLMQEADPVGLRPKQAKVAANGS